MMEIYWNLHRKMWSVREGGRVIYHTDSITLKDCRLIVRPSGRARVRRTGHKHVHAWVRGTQVPHTQGGNFARLRYNPHTDDGFHSDGIPVTEAAFVIFNPDGSAWVQRYKEFMSNGELEPAHGGTL